MKWTPAEVRDLTIGDVRRYLDSDPNVERSTTVAAVNFGTASLLSEWNRNRSRPWA